MQHLARNLAIELGPRNITTNTVAPGFFPSKLANGLIEKLGGRDELDDANPRKRLGEPEDIAGVMVYLCSPAGNYMYEFSLFIYSASSLNMLTYCRNGNDISVDGGMVLSSGRHSKL